LRLRVIAAEILGVNGQSARGMSPPAIIIETEPDLLHAVKYEGEAFYRNEADLVWDKRWRTEVSLPLGIIKPLHRIRMTRLIVILDFNGSHRSRVIGDWLNDTLTDDEERAKGVRSETAAQS